MSTQITINGATFDIPRQGENPPWGDDLSDAIIALSNALSGIVNSEDILTTSFTIANNQAVVANVTTASFDTSLVRSAFVNYTVYRTSGTFPGVQNTDWFEHSESGQIFLTYKSRENTWALTQFTNGTSGVTFSITTAGQLQYTSTNMTGGSYVGKLKFTAKTFLQA